MVAKRLTGQHRVILGPRVTVRGAVPGLEPDPRVTVRRTGSGLEPEDDPRTGHGDEHGNQKLLPTARGIDRTARRGSSGRGPDRRACLALILCGALAACGKKGALELPPEEEPTADQPPPADPFEEEDEERLRDES